MDNHRPPMATLGIFADQLDPQAVGQILLVQPEAAARKGDHLYFRSGKRTVPAKTGTWFISSTGHVTGGPAEHLGWLVDLVAPHITELRAGVSGLAIDLSLLVHDPQFDPKQLPGDLLQTAVRLGSLEIEVPESDEDFVIDATNVRDYLAT